MMMKGRRYIDYDRQIKTESACLLYKSIPMLIANKMLKVPQKQNDFNGIKPAPLNRIPYRQ